MISVYGSTGFIGSHFCNKYPDEVIKIPKGELSPKSSEILYLISTTTNYNVLKDATLDVRTNLLHFTKFLEKCTRFHTIHFISSWFVFGKTELPAKETSPCNPRGFYSITKRCAEQLLISYCQTFDIKYRIYRLANVYGVGDRYSKQKNAMQYLMDKIYNNETIELYYGGNFIRDYIHVDDVCMAIRHLMRWGEDNQIYNVGNEEPLLFKQIMEWFRQGMESKSEIVEIDPPEFHHIVQVKDFWMSNQKLRDTGFERTKYLQNYVDEYLQSKGA